MTKQKWSLGRAAFYGLILALVVLVVSNLADQRKNLLIWLNARPGEMLGYFEAQLLLAPIVFVVVALIRNGTVRAK
jgi:hypothetical protein